MDEDRTLLEVQNLKTYFFLDAGTVRAVDGLDLEIKQGKTLGMVGESGCGKSVTAQSIMRIVPSPGEIIEGKILYHRPLRKNDAFSMVDVQDLAQLSPHGREIRNIRGNDIAMIFQEPMVSLSPIYTIGNQIMEVILLHQEVSKTEARERTLEMLSRVRMPKPEQTIDNYPFELSGGMMQRGMIAMALSCHPHLLIADEPTTALDVTTEAVILELMRELQEELEMAIMFITHDLGVIAEMAEDVVVMYLGRAVEAADVESIYYDAKHPYTRALLRSIPRIGEKARRLESIRGMVPDAYTIPSGCPFHPRCPEGIGDQCLREEPPWVEIEPAHWVRCLLYAGE